MQAGTDHDAALIDASRRGDRAAYGQIIERYQGAVYAVAFSGVRDRALSDDITQDTFVVAWNRLADLRDTRRLPAWLCGIARNLGRDARKRQRRETPADDSHPIDATTPFEVLTDAESERIVEAALGEIPDVYREPLVLYYYEEHSIEDVARSLGLSAATTNKRLSRGRQYLAARVASIVERGLVRRGPRPGLAASVLAVIGIGLPASHVDASPLPVKGSTMSKLAIAAAVTMTLAGGGIFVATATRGGDAQARSGTAAPRGVAPTDEHCGLSLAHLGHVLGSAARSANLPALTPTARAAVQPLGNAVMATTPNDCATVGRHLAELDADLTHGPSDRPDEATCEQCAAHYTNMCESGGWSAERRACTLAADDLINAHLCAGASSTGGAAGDIPPELACSRLASHLSATVQADGMYEDVTDMPLQIEAACETSNWSVELRRCLAAGTTVDALQACIAPADTTH